MRRRLLTIAIFLLAGTVVNVAVAWGCAAHSTLYKRERVMHLVSYPPEIVPVDAPSHSRRLLHDLYPGFGIELELLYSYMALDYPFLPGGLASLKGLLAHTGVDATSLFLPESATPRRLRAGLPLRSLQAVSTAKPWMEGNRWRTAVVFESERERKEFPHLPRLLPLSPIWPDFALNTLFYAAILWLLIPGPFALRRLIRQRRGLCPACGYDLRYGEHDACPECGVTA